MNKQEGRGTNHCCSLETNQQDFHQKQEIHSQASALLIIPAHMVQASLLGLRKKWENYQKQTSSEKLNKQKKKKEISLEGPPGIRVH